jgi:hypothetical protein
MFTLQFETNQRRGIISTFIGVATIDHTLVREAHFQ